jgi:hypothetical protein
MNLWAFAYKFITIAEFRCLYFGPFSGLAFRSPKAPDPNQRLVERPRITAPGCKSHVGGLIGTVFARL